MTKDWRSLRAKAMGRQAPSMTAWLEPDTCPDQSAARSPKCTRWRSDTTAPPVFVMDRIAFGVVSIKELAWFSNYVTCTNTAKRANTPSANVCPIEAAISNPGNHG